MRLYVPEIGDHFVLEQDWTFTLYKEGRNSEVWDMLGCASHPSLVAPLAELREIRRELTEICDRMVHESGPAPWDPQRTITMKRFRPEDSGRYDELRHRERELEQQRVPVTLPAGTVLAVDRIYIRKGNGDYSSLTFYVKSTSLEALQPSTLKARGFKGGRKRFWAKLADVNTIEMQRVATEDAA